MLSYVLLVLTVVWYQSGYAYLIATRLGLLSRENRKLFLFRRLTLVVLTMAKHPRKRQKTHSSLPLGDGNNARLEMLLDEESKDDEERRLESMLFGVKYVPRGKGKGKELDDSEEDEDALDFGGRGMDHLLDNDV